MSPSQLHIGLHNALSPTDAVGLCMHMKLPLEHQSPISCQSITAVSAAIICQSSSSRGEALWVPLQLVVERQLALACAGNHSCCGFMSITVPKGTPVLPTSESQRDFTAAPSLRQLWSARSPFPLLKFRGKLKPFLELYKNKNIRSWWSTWTEWGGKRDILGSPHSRNRGVLILSSGQTTGSAEDTSPRMSWFVPCAVRCCIHGCRPLLWLGDRDLESGRWWNRWFWQGNVLWPL